MAAPKDINELQRSLLDAYDSVAKDPRRANQVKEMTNAAGKILASIKLQMEYSMIRGEEPEIPFMGKGSGKLLKPNARLLGTGTLGV